MKLIEQTKRVVTNFGRLSGLPAEVWTLLVICVVASAALFASAADPLASPSIVPAAIAFGAICVALAGALAVFARRVRFSHLWLVCSVLVAGLSVMVASAGSVEGTLIAAFAMIWVAVYAGAFFNKRQVIATLLVLSAGMLASLARNGVQRWPGIWILLTVTFWSTALILESAFDRIRRESETDELTGLLNRRGFLKAAALERSISSRVALPLGIAVIDLDDFKEVNDKRGHAAGDRLLAEATAAWKAELHEGDILGRFGGDEFVLLLPGADQSGVEQTLDVLRLAHPIAWSAGYSQWLPEESLRQCMERADQHLYILKMSKRPIDKEREIVAS